MKSVKLIALAVMLCVGSYLGYNAYNNATMTAEERLLMENIEALTEIEIVECPIGTIAGGINSASCSAGAGITVLGVGVTVECSVSCRDNAYACCGVHGCTCHT